MLAFVGIGHSSNAKGLIPKNDLTSHLIPIQDAEAQEEEAESVPLLARVLNVDPDNPPDIVVFLGRFHPLLVHLPITLLLLAALLEVMSRSERFADLRPAVSFVLFLGTASAVFAVVAGLLLSLSGDYGGDDLWWHKWLGIGVAVGALVAYFYKRRTLRTEAIPDRRIYRGALASAAVLLVAASHFGGSLTHGSGYLTSYMPEPFRSLAGIEPREEAKPIMLANVDEAHMFNDVIHPIMDARCVSCHNSNKRKGDLLLTSQSDILAGGENGPVFESGNATDSELYRRLILPSDHDDRMPPSGRKPLPDDHIELIRWWIDSGAPFDGTIAQLAPPTEVRDILDRMSDEAAEAAFALQVPPANPDAIAALSDLGVLVMPLSQETNLLQAQFLNVIDEFNDEHLNLLLPLSEQITWLNLGRTTVSDAGMPAIGQLKNLSRLHLEKTAVTDEGLMHLNNLQRLEYLNLYGTSVSDAGLSHLESLENLEALYLWQSDVTREGANELESVIPGLEVNLGWELSSDTTQTSVKLEEQNLE